MSPKYLLLVFFLSIRLSVSAEGYTVETIPNVQVADGRNFVSNPDGILSPATVARLDTMLYALRERNTAEVAVVAVRSIGTDDITEFANRLFAHWGIGRKEKDNGLLILFVEDQRQISFETGYGVEGILPDALAKRIQMQYMIPWFRKGDYDTGMIEGVSRVVSLLSDPEASAELRVAPVPDEGIDWKRLLLYYVLGSLAMTFIFIVLLRGALKSEGSRDDYAKYRALAPYNSALLFCSFLFPFFVAFVYAWYRRKLHVLRNGKHICDNCGGTMKKLNEQEDDHYLTPQEQTEERINSVDYDVWLCPNCNQRKIYPYENKYTRYKECPNCHAKAYSLASDRILTPATQFSQGTGEKEYRCEHCNFRKKLRYIIPMIIVAAGGRRGGGGFGGGFGGGRSGGGGATSGW